MQNFAVQYGAAAHIVDLPSKKMEYQTSANELFKDLYENSNLDKGDIVSQAFKKCGPQNQDFWKSKAEFNVNSVGPNEEVRVTHIAWWKHYEPEVSGTTLGCQVPGLQN